MLNEAIIKMRTICPVSSNAPCESNLTQHEPIFKFCAETQKINAVKEALFFSIVLKSIYLSLSQWRLPDYLQVLNVMYKDTLSGFQK